MKHDLLRRLEDKDAAVAVVGLGYVGLPLALSFVEKGFRVIGLDTDRKKVDTLARNETYIRHIPAERISRARETGRFQATDDFTVLRGADAILIAVPTPLTKNREPDLKFVTATAESLVRILRRGQIVVLESTTYPGTTAEVVAPILETSGLRANVDFFLGFSPEREDPSRMDYTTETIPKVVGADTAEALEVIRTLYSAIIQKVVPVSSTRVAEASKILENTFRAVNIALVNELKMTFMRMGIDIWDVIEAAKTKPFGFMPFYPGPGLGGHCIPIDPFYLTWKAREYDVQTRFIELAGEINSSMPDFVVSRAGDVLNEAGKALRGSSILILGLAYKPEVDDDRESPSYRLIEKLERKGAIVKYNDPFLPEIKSTREHSHLKGRRSVEVSDNFDLIIIATAHSAYRSLDFGGMKALVLDTRNVADRSCPNVFVA